MRKLFTFRNPKLLNASQFSLFSNYADHAPNPLRPADQLPCDVRLARCGVASATACEPVATGQVTRDELATGWELLVGECPRDLRFKFEHRFTKRFAPLDDPYRAARLVHRFIGSASQEVFVVVTLTNQLSPIAIRAVHVGTLDASLVDPRDVFRSAIVDGAASIFIAHNHPSGDPIPSEADHQVTHQLRLSGSVLGILVEDHIIVSSRYGFRFYSFAEEGLL